VRTTTTIPVTTTMKIVRWRHINHLIMWNLITCRLQFSVQTSVLS